LKKSRLAHPRLVILPPDRRIEHPSSLPTPIEEEIKTCKVLRATSFLQAIEKNTIEATVYGLRFRIQESQGLSNNNGAK